MTLPIPIAIGPSVLIGLGFAFILELSTLQAGLLPDYKIVVASMAMGVMGLFWLTKDYSIRNEGKH